MLFMHEIHQLEGRQEGAFEEAYREKWMKRLGESEDTRLLWYLIQPHGAGPSYNVITVTAFENATAWENCAKRIQSGDLNPVVKELDAMRHSVTGKLLRPLHWSKVVETDEAVVQIRIQASFQTGPGAGRRPEVTLMQKIFDHQQLLWLLTNELPETTTGPGTWMHSALEYRDQWESRLLRTAKWSPLY